MAGWAPTQPRCSKHPPLTPPWRARDGMRTEEEGRPPARRGRAGGFHWCPGHRGCRVTARVTAFRRNLARTTCHSMKWAGSGNSRRQLRCPLRPCPGPPKSVANPPPWISLPRCSVRCRSWPFPLPACTGNAQQTACQVFPMAQECGLRGVWRDVQGKAACWRRYMQGCPKPLQTAVRPRRYAISAQL